MLDNRHNKQHIKESDVIKSEVIEAKHIPSTHIPADEIDIEVKGKVVNCTMLFVRSNPNRESKPLITLNKDDEVRITDINASNDFYKVLTKTNIEGYCMKEYINIIK